MAYTALTGTTGDISVVNGNFVELYGWRGGSGGAFTLDFTSNFGVWNTTLTDGGYLEIRTNGTAIADIGTGARILGSGGLGTQFGLNARVGQSLVFGTSNLRRMEIDTNGNQINVLQTSVPTLAATREMVMTAISNTTIRISMRGSDGTTRSVDLTLA